MNFLWQSLRQLNYRDASGPWGSIQPTVKRIRASENRSHEKRIKHIGAAEKSKLMAVI